MRAVTNFFVSYRTPFLLHHHIFAMLPTITPETLGFKLPKKVNGKLIKSSLHKNFICTILPTMKPGIVDCVDKLNTWSPEFQWQEPVNPHGPHSTHVVDGRKRYVKENRVKEHNCAMEFQITGVGFRVC